MSALHTDPAHGNSPYSSNSAFAGNILLISPEALLEDGFLQREDLAGAPDFKAEHCDYEAVIPYKIGLLDKAFANFQASGRQRREFEGFCSINAYWLDDFALFLALKIKRFNWQAWGDWEKGLRDRQAGPADRTERPDRAAAVEE